jgi:hypothetical protein
MRYRFAVLTAAVVATLALAGSAVAFDCIRVSSSLQGLKQSTKSGNWLLFDLSSASGVQETFASVGEAVPTPAQAACFVSAYGESGQPLYFALGIGVAGPNGVLAHRNTSTTGDGKGIDHLERSGILPAIFAAADECGITLSGPE